MQGKRGQYTHIIRADAFHGLGTGHIMRCLALAQEFLSRGDRVVFMTHCDFPALIQRLEDEHCRVVRLTGHYPDNNDLPSLEAFLQDCPNPGVVVLDGYHFDRNYHLAARAIGAKVLVIDDHHHIEEYASDMLLNQNIGAPNIKYNLPTNRLFLGTQYALIRQEFLENIKRSCKPESIVNILVTMGGEDANNATLKAMRALKKAAPNAKVKVVAGAANPNLYSIEEEMANSHLDITLLQSVNDMAALMAWTDLCVSAGGSTCWELCLYGISSILVATADNQLGIVQGLEACGAAVYAGWHADLSEAILTELCVEIMNDTTRRNQLSATARKLVDGKGASRVVDKIYDTLLTQDEQ
jgi:UDP-2,4-diacetamido-2,4,6-trideoxy-beta-L-altropyranose hydrolase